MRGVDSEGVESEGVESEGVGGKHEGKGRYVCSRSAEEKREEEMK